jgi:hypothetical protein
MSEKGKIIKIEVSDTVIVRESLGLKLFLSRARRFISHSIFGWFPSFRKDLSPDGVKKIRIIDRKNKRYKEKIVDIKTGRIIRNVDEKLSEHKHN